MFREKKSNELVTYVGHVLHPHITCPGPVQVWDQTLGCDACGKELWTGKTREDEFYAEHPFIFEDCHDPGDSEAWTHEEYSPSIPFGSWRFPSYPPLWHGYVGYSWPGELARKYAEDYRSGYQTEHVFPVDTWSNHDPGDEA